MSGRWPSASFVALVLAWTGVVAFLCWGFSRPALDEAWRLHQELRSGRLATLSDGQVVRLEAVLRAHPRIAEDWLDGESVGLLTAAEAGWLRVPGAVLLRGRGAANCAALLLDVQVAQDNLPIEVEVVCGAWSDHRRIERPGVLELALPAPAAEVELCRLALRAASGRLEGPPGVRLLLPRGPGC